MKSGKLAPMPGIEFGPPVVSGNFPLVDKAREDPVGVCRCARVPKLANSIFSGSVSFRSVKKVRATLSLNPGSERVVMTSSKPRLRANVLRCQRIQYPRSPVSPSGIRGQQEPSITDTVVKTVSASRRPTLPTRWTCRANGLAPSMFRESSLGARGLGHGWPPVCDHVAGDTSVLRCLRQQRSRPSRAVRCGDPRRTSLVGYVFSSAGQRRPDSCPNRWPASPARPGRNEEHIGVFGHRRESRIRVFEHEFGVGVLLPGGQHGLLVGREGTHPQFLSVVDTLWRMGSRCRQPAAVASISLCANSLGSLR